MASIIHGAIGVGERRVPRVSNSVTLEQPMPAWHVSVGLSLRLGWAGLLLLAGLPCAGRPGLYLCISECKVMAVARIHVGNCLSTAETLQNQ